eukprot:JP446500.1.p1 GENE.JP446500.1~~JP446500.1.p1  ORF type:complete len:321 (+),score=120.58 JP446500.1:113-964(+)
MEQVIDRNFIEELNKLEHHWIAGENQRFMNMTVGEARKLLGARLHFDITAPKKKYEGVKIPDSFDSRKEWPDYIHDIRDQAGCGSCWAFSASEVLSDRLAIASDGQENLVLSPEDMVSCDKDNYACEGGMLDASWEYLQSTGIVSDSCYPYSSGQGKVDACRTTCVDGSPFTKYKAANYYHLGSVADIQASIMEKGPVQTGFMVYKSFMSYKSGIYKKGFFEFSPLGGHAVKIVGWGTENGVDYWIIANSWGTGWGENGYFRILRGKNECQLESQVFAGDAAV